MPLKDIRFQVYSVQTVLRSPNHHPTPLEDAIVEASNQTLFERDKLIATRRRRLEHAEISDEAGIALANLATFSYTGRGTGRRGAPLVAPAVGRDEEFAAEVAMLYDMVNEIAFVENSRSLNVSAIARYFQSFTGSSMNYEFTPRLSPEDAARLRAHKIIRRVELDMSMGEMTEFDRELGASVGQAMDDNLGADTVKVVFSVKGSRKRSLDVSSVFGLLNRIQGSNRTINNVDRARVFAKDEGNERVSDYDLFNLQEKRVFLLPVDDATRKVLFEDKEDALIKYWEDYIS